MSAESDEHDEAYAKLYDFIHPKHPAAEDCPIGECEVCAVRDCPHGDAMHHHHDGCPSCALPGETCDDCGAPMLLTLDEDPDELCASCFADFEKLGATA